MVKFGQIQKLAKQRKCKETQKRFRKPSLKTPTSRPSSLSWPEALELTKLGQAGAHGLCWAGEGGANLVLCCARDL